MPVLTLLITVLTLLITELHVSRFYLLVLTLDVTELYVFLLPTHPLPADPCSCPNPPEAGTCDRIGPGLQLRGGTGSQSGERRMGGGGGGERG
jgi:hypothetical protein